MKPIWFKEMNTILKTPPGKPDPECGDLPVHLNGQQSISCWSLGFWDRIQAMIFGKIWIGVSGKKSQPPVWLYCRRTVFKRRPKDAGLANITRGKQIP